MKRHLDHSDIEGLTDEDYRLLLNQQFESFRRLREQSQSLIRMILTGTGVVIALIGYRLYPEFQLPSRTLTAAGGTLQFDGALESIASNSLFVATVLMLSGTGLLFLSVAKAINVLSSNGPVPLSRHKTLERELEDRETGNSPKLKSWILSNDRRIVEAERKVEQSYLNIWVA